MDYATIDTLNPIQFFDGKRVYPPNTGGIMFPKCLRVHVINLLFLTFLFLLIGFLKDEFHVNVGFSQWGLYGVALTMDPTAIRISLSYSELNPAAPIF